MKCDTVYVTKTSLFFLDSTSFSQRALCSVGGLQKHVMVYNRADTHTHERARARAYDILHSFKNMIYFV